MPDRTGKKGGTGGIPLEEKKEMQRESIKIWEERYNREKNENDFINELCKLEKSGDK